MVRFCCLTQYTVQFPVGKLQIDKIYEWNIFPYLLYFAHQILYQPSCLLRVFYTLHKSCFYSLFRQRRTLNIRYPFVCFMCFSFRQPYCFFRLLCFPLHPSLLACPGNEDASERKQNVSFDKQLGSFFFFSKMHQIKASSASIFVLFRLLASCRILIKKTE